MRLKRLVSVAAAAVLALSVSLTAFAAPSTNISGVVTVDTKDNGVDGNGNTITASLAEVPAEYQSAVADVRNRSTESTLGKCIYRYNVCCRCKRCYSLRNGTGISGDDQI